MSNKWISELSKNDMLYFNSNLPFHIVSGDGSGGVTLLIRKNTLTWLVRLFLFGEMSRFVHDSDGVILVFNKLTSLIKIIDREVKVHAKYNIDMVEWSTDEYNEVWFGGKYGTKPTTERRLVTNPYDHWVKGYKAHFILEKPMSKRVHLPYHT